MIVSGIELGSMGDEGKKCCGSCLQGTWNLFGGYNIFINNFNYSSVCGK